MKVRVPPFCRKPKHKGKLSNEALAGIIRKRWAEVGYDVDVKVEASGIVSDLVAGLPKEVYSRAQGRGGD